MEKIDVLVIGSGLSGLITALSAADEGKQVLLLTKLDTLLSGNTQYAQGGIIYKGINDSPEKLENDIEIAGDYHSFAPAVQQLAEMGPELVDNYLIERCKVPFDMNNGRLDLTAEGAHSEHRIIHSKDKTGLTIHEAVIAELVKHPNIQTRTNTTVVDLLTLSHHSSNSKDIYEKPACFGVFALDNESKKVYPIFAQQTVLATGGIGQLFTHTSNPDEATGDGLALAWRAGARCFNLEYIQFHPTTFYHKGGDRFLISEAVRGEGGKLVDKNGKPFMHEFHEQGDLAPRDIVARSIHHIMLRTNHPCVYLDISFKDSKWLQERFPTIYKNCKDRGIDITKEPIPVVPAAHYFCGGVGVNLNGRTSLQRLYAVGEVACTGVHGANRLASTSLLEAIVWGHYAGKDAAINCSDDPYYPDIYAWESGNQYIDPALIAQDWTTIKNSMWNYVGLVRTKIRLSRAKAIFRHLQTEIGQFYREAQMTKEIVELRNGIECAIAITQETIAARTSKGTHYLKE